MRATTVLLGLGLGLGAFGLGACDGLDYHLDCTEEPGICDPVDGGADVEGGGDVVVPPGCDLTKSPKDSAACVDDGVGVFVSAAGDDGATGKKAAPVKSLAKAVELAASRGLPRVYVCEGTYETAVEIKTAVAIYGGMTCAWAPSDTAKARLAPPKGIALRVSKVSGAVLVEDLDISGSADANTPGDSAIAAFVSESTNVTFRRSNLSAGAGTAGAKGVSRSNYTGAAATPGGLTNTSAAGVGPTCACMDGTGSKGGAGANGTGVGIENGSATPVVGTLNSGSTGAGSCTPATAGANGAASTPGSASAAPGALTSAGWGAAASVQSAPAGSPGQGGGGGGARSDLNLGGGGGGCGGCGGAGGGAGGNGGSSFGLLSFNSVVQLEGGALVSMAGADGGAGADGEPGQGGGAFGAGVCNGGPGGSGAGGSGGGGGAGGHSVPVAFIGTEPKVTTATVTPGAKGAAGPGGAPGAGPGNPGATGAPGAEGKSQSSLPL
jgi:hypothetical protein